MKGVLWMAYRKYKKRSADEVRKAPVRSVRKRHYMLRTRRDGAWSCGITARELSQVNDCARGIRAITDEDHTPNKKPNCSSLTYVKPIPDFPRALPMEMNAPLRRGGAGALFVKTAVSYRFGGSPTDQSSIERNNNKNTTSRGAVPSLPLRAPLPATGGTARHKIFSTLGDPWGEAEAGRLPAVRRLRGCRRWRQARTKRHLSGRTSGEHRGSRGRSSSSASSGSARGD